MRLSLVWTCAFIISIPAWIALAADPPATQPGAVRATTIAGERVEGTWQGVGPDGALQIRTSDGHTTTIPGDEAMSLRFAGDAASQPADSADAVFHLADGSRFNAKILSGGSRELTISTHRVENAIVPLAMLAALRFAPAAGGEAQEVFSRALTDRNAAQDLLISTAAGRVTSIRGATEQLTPEGGSFRWRDRSVPIRPDAVYGIVFARGVQPAAPPPVRCHLRDGEVWAGQIAGGDPDHLGLLTRLGPTLRLPVVELSELRFRSGRVVLLSDLEPSDYHFEPFAVTHWPYRRDRSASNGPLRIAGQVFDRGLGMHARSTLVYQLEEDYSQLAAVIGIDDAVRPRGNVVFRVVADGTEVFNSGPVSGERPPLPILVSLNRPKRLELHVDFGEGLDIGDHANWGQARLIK